MTLDDVTLDGRLFHTREAAFANGGMARRWYDERLTCSVTI